MLLAYAAEFFCPQILLLLIAGGARKHGSVSALLRGLFFLFRKGRIYLLVEVNPAGCRGSKLVVAAAGGELA
jgi:hypothetical protein